MQKKVLLLLVILALCAGFGKCGKKSADQTLRERLPIVIPSPLPVTQTYLTPNGVLVGGNFAVTDDSFLADVDAGIARTLRVTEHLGYSQWRDFRQYTILYSTPTSYSADSNCPTLNLKNGQKIAGTVIGVGDIVLEPPFILIAYAPLLQSNTLCRDFRRDAVSWESEHIQAWYNDRNFFWATTGINDFHPMYSENTKINPNAKPEQGREVLFNWHQMREQIIDGIH